MEQKQKSSAFLRKRKFLMLLPLMTLPFITLFFIALGGGKGTGKEAQNSHGSTGLNLKLPDAHFKRAKEKDKLGLYEQAGKDSMRLREAIKHDPYFRIHDHFGLEDSLTHPSDLESIMQPSGAKSSETGFSSLKPSRRSQSYDPNEEKLMARLEVLKNELGKKTAGSTQAPIYGSSLANPGNPELEKLENMMHATSSNNQANPEMNQLSGMLDKIILIQHPEGLQDSLRSMEARMSSEAYPVFSGPIDYTITSINYQDSIGEAQQNAFYDVSDDYTSGPEQPNPIKAVIDETQTLVTGSVVKLRLLEDIHIHGTLIPKDDFIFGISSISNERLKITISSIICKSKIFPVSLNAYDLDGLEGIHVPGSISRDVSKESADQAMESMNITSLDPSLGAQAANAGIQTAKALMSKKIKQVRVTIKEGYQLLLKDKNQK